MIRGKSIILTPLKKKHLEFLRQLRNDPQTNIFLTNVLPINQHLQEQWFKTISLDKTKMYFAIENNKNQFLGVVRCDEYDKVNRSIRVGMDIIPKHRRKGLATATYQILFQYLFLNLGLNRLWLLVASFNKPAIALYKKLGFKQEGKQRQAIFRNGKFNDYLMMSLIQSEYQKKK